MNSKLTTTIAPADSSSVQATTEELQEFSEGNLVTLASDSSLEASDASCSEQKDIY